MEPVQIFIYPHLSNWYYGNPNPISQLKVSPKLEPKNDDPALVGGFGVIVYGFFWVCVGVGVSTMTVVA